MKRIIEIMSNILVKILCVSVIAGCAGASVQEQHGPILVARAAMAQAEAIIVEVCSDPNMGSDVKEYCPAVEAGVEALGSALDIYITVLENIEFGESTEAELNAALINISGQTAVLVSNITRIVRLIEGEPLESEE